MIIAEMTNRNLRKTDVRIDAALRELSSRDAAYWEFRRQAQRAGLHGLFQYPAMMVPRMQGDILDTVLEIDPAIKSVWDPFVGAGTTLTETMLRGRDFYGSDINPLAVLTCEAKSKNFNHRLFGIKANAVLSRISNDIESSIDVDFQGRDKWFSLAASQSLSRIRRAILQERTQWARKIMWVVLSEVIRRTSNSRTSTYKLHERPKQEQESQVLPHHIFSVEIYRAVERIKYHQELFESKGLVKKGRFLGKVKIRCGDVRSHDLDKNIPGVDMIITSPPYGDNRSTVPYGQFSYLALNWIPPTDLPGEAILYMNTHATDYRSLGGSTVAADKKSVALSLASKQFESFNDQLSKLGRKDLSAKVSSFLFDFYESVARISSSLNSGGISIWTLGDRTVGGLRVPLSEICREFHEGLGLRHVATVKRNIPCKRAPLRNAISATMGSETLLVMRNG